MSLKRFPYQKWLCLLIMILLMILYFTSSKDLPLFPTNGDKAVIVQCNDTKTSKWRQTMNPDLPIIFFVTPTYARREQYPELIRLAQTLSLVPNLMWIVAEDSSKCSDLVKNLLNRFSSISSVHLASPMPKLYESAQYKPRGVSSRNAALEWIVNHVNRDHDDGVVYFGDDDNTYDLKLFEEIRSTKKVSMFPVGLIATNGLSSPIVQEGKVIGFADPWFARRKFPVDMAGFAFNVKLLWANPSVRMPYKAGHEEDLLLKGLNIELSDIEPKAKDCTEVLVWHTQAVKAVVPKVKLKKMNKGSSSLNKLLMDLKSQGILDISEEGKEISLCYENHLCS